MYREYFSRFFPSKPPGPAGFAAQQNVDNSASPADIRIDSDLNG